MSAVAGGQQTACNCLRMFHFQVAPLVSGTAVHANPPLPLADPVKSTGPMVGFERGQRPVGVGEHVDAAFRADQNGHVGRF